MVDTRLCCTICGDDEAPPYNLFVICDGCNIVFHQKCYGAWKLPPGDEPYYCRPCELDKKKREIKCKLCQTSAPTGYKPIAQSKDFAHLICANWLPGCQVAMSHLPHERKMRELAELNRWAAHERLCLQVVHELSAANADRPVPPSVRWQEPILIHEVLGPQYANQLCSICKVRGGCLRCCESKCKIAFHPFCALNSGLLLLDDDDTHGPGELSGQRQLFCSTHKPPEKKEAEISEEEQEEEEEKQEKQVEKPTKRGRGRPPKKEKQNSSTRKKRRIVKGAL